MMANRMDDTPDYKAPTELQIQRQVERNRAFYYKRQEIAREQRRIMLGTFDVPRPEGMRHWTEIRSTMGAQTAGRIKGMFSFDMPTVDTFISSLSKKSKKDAQAVENALNNIFIRLEEQNGVNQQVWEPVVNDLVLVGGGVTRLRAVPHRMAEGLPKLDYNDPTGYITKRSQAIKGKGGFLSSLPLQYEWVLWERFLFYVDEESGGLSETYELKTRRLSNLLDSPHYKGSELHAFYSKLSDSEQALAGGVLVDCWEIETPGYTAYYADGCSTQLASGMGGDYLYLSTKLDGDIRGGTLLDVKPNPYGRSTYTVFPGLSMGAEDPAIRTYGVNYITRSAIRALSLIESIKVARMANFAAPPWIASQQATQIEPGVFGFPARGPDGKERVIKLKAGEITWMPPGTAIQEMTSANHDAVEQVAIEMIKNDIDAMGISDKLFSSDNGYAINQILATVMALFKPLERNIKLAWMDQVRGAITCLKYMGEPLSILVGTRDRKAEWYTLDPDVFDDMEFHIKPRFELKQPVDMAAAIQNALAVTQGELMSRETAMSDFLAIRDVDHEKDLMTLTRIEQSPNIQQMLEADVMQRSGLAAQQADAAQQGDISPDQMAGAPPALQQALQEQAKPGMPGYNTIQGGGQPGATPPQAGVPQAAGQGPPPQLPPGGGPHTPGPVKGRAAGQARRPGGARRQGGPAVAAGGH